MNNKRFIAKAFWVFDSELEFTEIKAMKTTDDAKKIASILNETYEQNFSENDVLTKLIDLKLISLSSNC